MRSLGIDVGVRRGLDLVLLDDTLVPGDLRRRVRVEELEEHVREIRPDVIAIDAPPAWGTGDGGSRLTERELRRFGIQSFGTPSNARRGEHPFYRWMTVGFAAFEAVRRCGFPRFRSGPARGSAMEVFPHASAVVLAGCLPPRDASKRDFRRAALRTRGVDVSPLRSIDQLDATLAALTGLLAARGRCFAPGDPKEGIIVLPARSLPPPPFRRCAGRSGEELAEPTLPGFAPCSCGDPSCTALTSSEFAPGHDAKRKSMLWARARTGDEAVEELRRRRWELPPEMR